MILEESDIIDYIRGLKDDEVIDLLWNSIKTYSGTKAVALGLLSLLEEDGYEVSR